MLPRRFQRCFKVFQTFLKSFTENFKRLSRKFQVVPRRLREFWGFLRSAKKLSIEFLGVFMGVHVSRGF